MRTIGVAAFLSWGVIAMNGCSESADLVFLGGVVWTGTSASASAVAVSGGRIIAVADDAEIEKLVGDRTTRIPLQGRMLIPGFIDNHTHFISGGFTLAGVRLRDAATPQEFVRRIAAFAQEHPGEWMRGGTWDHELWGGELPRRDWIDSVTGSTPVLVTRLDGHMSLANSRALELAGVTAETADVPGGTIVRYPDGEPTGVLKDAAEALVARVIPQPSPDEIDRALQAAARHAVERGVTHITDMAGGEGSWDGLAAYRRAAARGRLPIRVYAAVPVADWERLERYVAVEGKGDDRLAWGVVKGFVDGSLGSTTAWFYAPYADEPTTSGLMITDTTELRGNILAADAAGLHVVIHAIGDHANDWLLDVFAEAQETNQRTDQRFRIEHAQHLTREAIQRFASDDVIPAMQPYHVIDDGRWAEKRIGPERVLTTYAFRDLIDAGAKLSFGSDWTVAPLDPLFGIYAALTRRTIDGANPGGWVPEQKITVEEALRAYTINNAHGAYLENELGTIEVGKCADLVVLDRDLFAIDAVEIEKVRVDLTMVGGEMVYQRR